MAYDDNDLGFTEAAGSLFVLIAQDGFKNGSVADDVATDKALEDLKKAARMPDDEAIAAIKDQARAELTEKAQRYTDLIETIRANPDSAAGMDGIAISIIGREATPPTEKDIEALSQIRIQQAIDKAQEAHEDARRLFITKNKNQPPVHVDEQPENKLYRDRLDAEVAAHTAKHGGTLDPIDIAEDLRIRVLAAAQDCGLSEAEIMPVVERITDMLYETAGVDQFALYMEHNFG